MARTKVIGLNKVLRNLKSEMKKIKGKTLEGLIHAGIIVIRDMEFVPPRIPVDTGNLRASQYLTTSMGKTQLGGSRPNFKGKDAAKLASNHASILASQKAELVGRIAVVLGFTAFYAFFVHEAVGKSFKRSGSGPKFLEAALKRNQGKMLQTIQKHAKIK